MVYKNRTNQKYEEYWKTTFELTGDWGGNKDFYKAIEIIKKAIDDGYRHNSNNYQQLQQEIIKKCGTTWNGKDPDANARKLINQTV